MAAKPAKSVSTIDFGFFRLGVASPEHRVADCAFNAAEISQVLERAQAEGCQLVVFPELSITGYSCADLFYQPQLLAAAGEAIVTLSETCARLHTAAVVGTPMEYHGRLYNVAVVIGAHGEIAGVVPKTYLPTSGEFYEARWFTRGDLAAETSLEFNGRAVPFGVDLLFSVGDALIGVEICEDLWAIKPPSLDQATAGANVLLNLSASNELLGKVGYRRDLVRQQSARCLAAYAYASAGPGESTTDVVYSGHSMITENGATLIENDRFKFHSQLAIADVDLAKLSYDRTRNSSFAQTTADRTFRVLSVSASEWRQGKALHRPVDAHPFVPADAALRSEHCREIFAIQATGLAKRLRHTGSEKLVLGLSGGLDSTLAALVACHAFDTLGLDRKGIVALSMPGFGTTARTQANAAELAKMLKLTFREISISASVRQHFDDIGHPESKHDVTFENAQARERTQILMDVANQTGGFVLGTGDLSELALGWCTFNADHMSMYHVNAGVPKTLVRYLVEWGAAELFTGKESEVLMDISRTPISPELLPAAKDGTLTHKTEDLVGPYELHDFFLYQMIRCGSEPAKIQFLAEIAFKGSYSPALIRKWLAVFVKRFFAQQFKRNAMPDGPKVGSVALSPRGDWRMPSDVSPAAWLGTV